MFRRFVLVMSGLFAGAVCASCVPWPEELDSLASSIARQVDGEAMAWRVGGDVVVISVGSSPLYGGAAEELEGAAAAIAAQAVESSEVPIESVAVTFHEGEISDDPDRMREFIFILVDGRLTRAEVPDA